MNSTFLQPFFSYGTKTGYSFTVNTEATANWEVKSGERWTVPINFQMAKVTRLGKRPLSVGIGPGFYTSRSRRVGQAGSCGPY